MINATGRTSIALALLLLMALPVPATEKGAVIHPFNGKNLDGWKAVGGSVESSGWSVGIAKLNADKPGQLAVTPAGDKPGELVTAAGHGRDFYTEQKFGDCTLEVETMVPKGSNSGIYLMGEYEIQVLDSYGREKIGPGDMGGLYAAKAADVNASLKPGQWQKFVFEFQAPRFANGKKTANARLIKVTLNGKVIHKNVELLGKTPGGVSGKEAPEGPLMFQGNHGAVAFRNIKITVPKK